MAKCAGTEIPGQGSRRPQEQNLRSCLKKMWEGHRFALSTPWADPCCLRMPQAPPIQWSDPAGCLCPAWGRWRLPFSSQREATHLVPVHSSQSTLGPWRNCCPHGGSLGHAPLPKAFTPPPWTQVSSSDPRSQPRSL